MSDPNEIFFPVRVPVRVPTHFQTIRKPSDRSALTRQFSLTQTNTQRFKYCRSSCSRRSSEAPRVRTSYVGGARKRAANKFEAISSDGSCNLRHPDQRVSGPNSPSMMLASPSDVNFEVCPSKRTTSTSISIHAFFSIFTMPSVNLLH